MEPLGKKDASLVKTSADIFIFPWELCKSSFYSSSPLIKFNWGIFVFQKIPNKFVLCSCTIAVCHIPTVKSSMQFWGCLVFAALISLPAAAGALGNDSPRPARVWTSVRSLSQNARGRDQTQRSSLRKNNNNNKNPLSVCHNWGCNRHQVNSVLLCHCFTDVWKWWLFYYRRITISVALPEANFSSLVANCKPFICHYCESINLHHLLKRLMPPVSFLPFTVLPHLLLMKGTPTSPRPEGKLCTALI